MSKNVKVDFTSKKITVPHYNEQVEFDEDGKMTFAAKKEANAAAGDDAAKAEVEEHDEPAALPTAEAGVNEDDVDSVA